MVNEGIELIEIENLRPAEYVDLREVLLLYSKILTTGIVEHPVVIDGETNVILDGHDTFYTLDLLSAIKIPVIKIDISNIRVESLQCSSPSITKENIIEAGIKGPKLPPKSFKISSRIPQINIPLENLLPKVEKDVLNLKVYNSTIELLYKGWPTPLVKLNSLSTNGKIVWAKLEGLNPFSNSIKDRTAWSMLSDVLENGKLGHVIYEATSTNTGIALTSIANTLGIKTRLYIPKTIQKVSDIYLKVLGAEVVRLPVNLTSEALKQVEVQARADNAMHLNQFENDANFKVHLKYTAREIDQQLQSIGLKPSCIIGSLGTSGHMSAISFYFKSKYGNDVKVVGVQPSKNEVIPGIRRIETGMKWIHWTKLDDVVDVTQKEAIEAAISIARREGLLIGLSAGAVVSAFNKIARDNGVYVLIFPDTGYKYAEQFETYFKTQKG